MENPAFKVEELNLKRRYPPREDENDVDGPTKPEGFHMGTEAGKMEAKDPVSPDPPGQEKGLELKRRVGLCSGIALIVGTMIGSGIFVSPKGLLERTGSVGLSLVIWGACGVLSMLGALAYTELGTMIPYSGAEYSYFLEAFGGVPAFLFAWVSVFVLRPSMLAIICLSFAKYLVEAFVDECDPPLSLVKLVGILTLGMITFVNCYDVELATKVQNLFTAAKLLAIAVIMVGGIIKLAQGNTQYLETGFQGSTRSYGDIATAFYSGLWAYDGWNQLNYVTEELVKPNKNLPRGILIGIPMVIVCYLMVNVSYLAVMSTNELLGAEAVAVTWGNRMLGVFSGLMPLAVTLSTFGAANGSAFTSGRLCFVAAREGHLVDILSYVHTRRYTPTPALVFNTLVAVAMMLAGDIGNLIDFFGFTAWIFYGGAMLALIVMRKTRPEIERPYKVPIIIPIVVLVISVYLVIAPIVDNPQIEYLYAMLFIVAGLIFYIPFVHYKIVLSFMDKFTVFFQMLLEAAPTQVMPAAT